MKVNADKFPTHLPVHISEPARGLAGVILRAVSLCSLSLFEFLQGALCAAHGLDRFIGRGNAHPVDVSAAVILPRRF